MFGLGTTEIIILAGILVLLFGSKKIADLAGGVAEAIKIFRNAFKEEGAKKKEAEIINKIDSTKN